MITNGKLPCGIDPWINHAVFTDDLERMEESCDLKMYNQYDGPQKGYYIDINKSFQTEEPLSELKDLLDKIKPEKLGDHIFRFKDEVGMCPTGIRISIHVYGICSDEISDAYFPDIMFFVPWCPDVEYMMTSDKPFNNKEEITILKQQVGEDLSSYYDDGYETLEQMTNVEILLSLEHCYCCEL